MRIVFGVTSRTLGMRTPLLFFLIGVIVVGSLVYFISAAPKALLPPKAPVLANATAAESRLEPPPLVLVHVGEIPAFFPAFLSATVRQAIRWNPRMRVYAIVPRAYLASEAGADLLALGRSGFSESDEYWLGRVTIMELENVTVAAEGSLARFRATTRLNTGEMGGFVRFTTERLFVVAAVMAQLHLEEVFHMEIDNVLFVDVTDLLPALRRLYSGLAATILSRTTMTAGFLYVRSAAALENLLGFILNATEHSNDMFFLSDFAAQHPSALGKLPVAPVPDPGGPDPQLLASILGDAGAFSALGGFFDNAAHGQWLGGAHSIHTGDVVRPHYDNKIALFSSSSYLYKWDVDPMYRLRRPYIRHRSGSEDSWRPLFTAHVHSKQIELFAS